MKALAWISTAILVIVTGAVWFWSTAPADSGGAGGEGSVAQAPPGEAFSEGPSQRRDATRTTEEPPPALAPHLPLVRELWAVLGTGDEVDSRRERELLGALVDEGSEEALSAVVEALEDPRCVHHGDGAAVQALLAPLLDAPSPSEHPRLFHFARRRVEEFAVPGSALHAVGYLSPWFDIAARSGGERGLRYVLGHLYASDPVLRQAAAVVAGGLDDPEELRLVLGTLLGDLGLDEAAAKLLAFELTRRLAGNGEAEDGNGETSDLPSGLRAALFALALGQEPPTEELPPEWNLGELVATAGEVVSGRRALLLEFLGAYLDEQYLDDYLLLYRQPQTPADLRSAAALGLRRVRVGETLSETSLQLVLAPFALELLAAADEVESARGAAILRDVPALHATLGAKAAVQARLEQGSSATLAAELKSALAVLEQ